MYAHISFGVQEHAQLGEKKVCLWSWLQIFGKMTNNKWDNSYLGSNFIAGKYVLKVCFECLIRMIFSLKYISGCDDFFARDRPMGFGALNQLPDCALL